MPYLVRDTIFSKRYHILVRDTIDKVIYHYLVKGSMN